MENSLKLTKSVEDYLEVMYNLEKEKGAIKIKDIASKMNVKPPSVVEALKKLADHDMVSYEPYKDIKLNKKGLEIAEDVIHKHEILKNFLHILGVDMNTADADACSMEHVLDGSTIKKLKKFAEFTEIWPYADEFLDSFRYYEKNDKLPP
jgi:DtxR family transcriptional regulator, Mn-dependent transcriptional regulator